MNWLFAGGFSKIWVDGNFEATLRWDVVVVVRMELSSTDFGSRSDVALVVVGLIQWWRRGSVEGKVGESHPRLKEGRRFCLLNHWKKFFFFHLM